MLPKGKFIWAVVLMAALFRPGGGSGATETGPAPGERLYDFSGFERQLEPYLALYHDPAFPFDPHDLRGRFSYQRGRGYDLYGCADMVYLLWTMGELDARTTPEGRRDWAALLQSFQDPETGWFSRGNETLHFKEHATAYATGALALLGARPLHPFRWARELTSSKAELGKWLSRIWWDEVWVGSHQGGGAAASLLMSGEAPEEWFDWYFDWLDREANPRTGLWQRAFFNKFTERPTMHDLGGAAHFWWIYQHRGRPMPYPRRVIDTVLGLQLESGLWDKKLIKGDFPYCINLDAVNGLKAAWLELSGQGEEYRTHDIVSALDRYFFRCHEVLTKDGSVAGLYDNSHDLPGAIIGVAEADGFFRAATGKSRIRTSREWRSVLDVICWL
ncbi:MAG TPA: hypothetical protein VM658_11875 [bacterium]|nr:hypothetical protein [bacterium]